MTAASLRTVRSLALVLAACSATPTPPGDQQMGDYAFHAELGDSLCGLSSGDEVPTVFDFSARFSRFADGHDAFVTIGGVVHSGATFDGQRMKATYSAERVFSSCLPCRTTMTETLDVVLLSKSQSDALGGACNTMPPLDPDGGILGPGVTESGFDAVRACGSLSESVVSASTESDDAGICMRAPCTGCLLRYDVRGDRR